MAGPILGPFVEESYNDTQSTGSFWEKKEVWRQAKPYTIPLPYYHWKLVTTGLVGEATDILALAHAGHSPWYSWAKLRTKGDDYAEIALLKARTQFVENAVGAASQLGATLGERRQAATMIVARAKTLRSVFSSLRRGDLHSAARVLATNDPKQDAKVRKNPKHYAAKSVGNQFLEMHFGWIPTIKDLYNAAEVFSRPIPYGKVRGYGKMPIKVGGQATSPGQWTETGSLRGEVRAYVGASVGLENPDLFLLQQLGLANPASVAWELVPFSFVADWVATLGAYLSSLTDLLGVQVIDPWHGIRSEERGTYSYSNYGDKELTLFTQASGYWRYQGLPDVPIQFRPTKDLSITRAASAIALLIQKLPSR